MVLEGGGVRAGEVECCHSKRSQVLLHWKNIWDYILTNYYASCLDSYNQKGFDTLPNTIKFPKGCSRHGINEFLVSGLLSIFITLQSYSRYVLSR
jgi:hypothetical protein